MNFGVGRYGQLGDVLAGVNRRCLDADARVEVADDGHHAGIQHFLGDFLAGGRIGPVVHRDDFKGDGLALDIKTFLVEFGYRQLDAVVQILAECGKVARKRLGDAYPDGGRRVVAAGERQGGGGQCNCGCGQCEAADT